RYHSRTHLAVSRVFCWAFYNRRLGRQYLRTIFLASSAIHHFQLRNTMGGSLILAVALLLMLRFGVVDQKWSGTSRRPRRVCIKQGLKRERRPSWKPERLSARWGWRKKLRRGPRPAMLGNVDDPSCGSRSAFAARTTALENGAE